MRLAAILLFIIASLVGTLIAMALFSMVDDDDAPEAMTGDDYPNASEATDR